jgi:surfactin synthase thioesterase subunit
VTVSLLCLPCAGASASLYSRWQRTLPRWIRLVPIELPGRGMRLSESFIEDFDELIEQLCQEHERHCNGRYALYGHSMGALLAYGMTMRWRSLSRRLPDVIFASASPAPGRRDPANFVGKETDAALIADLHKQGGTPSQIFDSPELLTLTLDALRADYRVCASFRPRLATPLPMPIHVFAGRHDDIAAERILAWQAETSAAFSVRWFDGGHFFIRQHEAAVLSTVIRGLSDETQARAGQAVPLATMELVNDDRHFVQ